MPTQYQVSLESLHTMRCSGIAAEVIEIQSEDDLVDSLRQLNAQGRSYRVVGGGSNILFAADYPGCILKMVIAGVSVQRLSESEALISAAAGENWHVFVRKTIDMGFNGLENLSLIPGSVGAAPMQNIGAYGVELKDHLESVTALHRETFEKRVFSLADCEFGYRDSIFKKPDNPWIILSVTFKLSRYEPLSLEYQELRNAWEQAGRPESAKAVSDLVCQIRQNKLPDPEQIPNSGSFFKNPVVNNSVYEHLKQRFPEMVAFPQGNDWKLAAGWLIQACGLKGVDRGGVGTYPKQALVLVNPGHRPGREVVRFAEEIISAVHTKFGVTLEREPVVI